MNWCIYFLSIQGFAIGNGLTDPLVQYKAYTDYALDMGLIKVSDYTNINRKLPACETAIKLCGNFFPTLQEALEATKVGFGWFG